MEKTFWKVVSIKERKNIGMRMAAYVIGVGRVAEATRLRGLYP